MITAASLSEKRIHIWSFIRQLYFKCHFFIIEELLFGVFKKFVGDFIKMYRVLKWKAYKIRIKRARQTKAKSNNMVLIKVYISISNQFSLTLCHVLNNMKMNFGIFCCMNIIFLFQDALRKWDILLEKSKLHHHRRPLYERLAYKFFNSEVHF